MSSEQCVENSLKVKEERDEPRDPYKFEVIADTRSDEECEVKQVSIEFKPCDVSEPVEEPEPAAATKRKRTTGPGKSKTKKPKTEPKKETKQPKEYDITSDTCPECGYIARRKSHLKRHLQTHNDIKPFPCNECSSSFKRKDQLVRHMKLHTREQNK